MHVGEKIETVLRCRSYGSHGEYLGIHHDNPCCSMVIVENYEYHIHRSVETNEPFYIIHKVSTDATVICHDQYEIGCVRDGDFIPNTTRDFVFGLTYPILLNTKNN